jgi:hypothetical protein
MKKFIDILCYIVTALAFSAIVLLAVTPEDTSVEAEQFDQCLTIAKGIPIDDLRQKTARACIGQYLLSSATNE